jgi:hypothetical protein
VCGGFEPAALGKKRAFVSFGLQKKEIHFLCGFRINIKIGVLMIICPLIAALLSFNEFEFHSQYNAEKRSTQIYSCHVYV